MTYAERLNRRQGSRASRAVPDTDPVAFAVVVAVTLGTTLLAGVMTGELMR